MDTKTKISDFELTGINGKPLKLSDYAGKVLIIVNTASKCGFAPQMQGLEDLYKKYGQDGLVVVGTPSNQFHQELANDEDTASYCQAHYGVTFPLSQRVRVNGADEDPLWAYLKEQSGGGRIKWNFTKFVIDRHGEVIRRYAPATRPAAMEETIRAALNLKK
ncbi:glutathione peroxidase [Lacticaseibacillus zhaodongensis]|uniref:glutathione peroxidase n=1 Tax=Lacticaseibacillus zhaodongensis TaxID=2668065 RepID=UPI0012D34E1A|nr:glutathione peroxidase [Lacticaseibacillus zhaodongensis]